MRIVRRVVSPIGVLLAFLVGAWALRWLTAGSLTAVRDGALTFDALLVFVVAVLAWACFAWLAFGTVLMALSALPGAIGAACGSLAERVTPAFYRRAARVALGLSVAAGPVLGSLPANAATVDQPTQAAAAAQMLPGLDRPGTIDSQLPGGIQLPDLDRPGGTDIRNSQLPMPDRPSSASSGRIGFDRPGCPIPTGRRPPTQSPGHRCAAPTPGSRSSSNAATTSGTSPSSTCPRTPATQRSTASGTGGTTPTGRSSGTTPI